MADLFADPITILEAIATVFYAIAIYISWKGFKKSSPDFQIVFVLIIIGMFLGALTSLMDVFEWARIGALFLVEGIEEVFTPLFGLVWIAAAYIAIKRTKNIQVKKDEDN